MIRDTALTVISAVALILGACGYSGQDEPNESGTNRSEAGVEPARETYPDPPQVGDTETGSPQGELLDEPWAKEDTTSKTGEDDEESSQNI